MQIRKTSARNRKVSFATNCQADRFDDGSPTPPPSVCASRRRCWRSSPACGTRSARECSQEERKRRRELPTTRGTACAVAYLSAELRAVLRDLNANRCLLLCSIHVVRGDRPGGGLSRDTGHPNAEDSGKYLRSTSRDQGISLLTTI